MIATANPSDKQNSQPPPNVEYSSMLMWLCLTGGGLAWTAHFMISATLSEWGTITGLHHHVFLGVNLIAWVIVAVTGLSLGGVFFALWGSMGMLRHFRELANESQALDNAKNMEPRAGSLTGCYLMTVGVCANWVFLLIILAQSIPVFFYAGAY